MEHETNKDNARVLPPAFRGAEARDISKK